MRRLRIPAKTYRRKGKLIRRKAYTRADVGAPGRTPKAERWYEPKVTETGWSKEEDQETRIQLMLEAHDYDYLAAARALNALANVTKDKSTAAKARSDAKRLFALHRQYKIGKEVEP